MMLVMIALRIGLHAVPLRKKDTVLIKPAIVIRTKSSMKAIIKALCAHPGLYIQVVWEKKESSMVVMVMNAERMVPNIRKAPIPILLIFFIILKLSYVMFSSCFKDFQMYFFYMNVYHFIKLNTKV